MSRSTHRKRGKKLDRSREARWVRQTLNNAIALHQAGSIDAAATLYRQVLDVAPRNADARHLLGVIAHQKGDHQRAIDHISDAIAVNPSSADFHLNLGSAYQAIGHVDKAIDCFEHSLRLNPESPVTHNNLANALRQQGKFRDSLVHYKESLRLNPQYAEARCNLGVVLSELGELEAAEVSLQRALQINPRLVEAYSNLGIVQSKRGDAETAVRSYLHALELRPRQAETWSNLGNLLRDQGKVAEAKIAYGRVYEIRTQPLWKLRSVLPCPVIPQSNEEIDEFRDELETNIAKLKGVRLTSNPDDLSTSNCEAPFYLPYHGRNDRQLKSAYAGLFGGDLTPLEPQVYDGIMHVGFVVADRRERVFLRFVSGILNRLCCSDLKVSVVCSSIGRELIAKSLTDERIQYVTIPNRLSAAAATIRAAAIDVLYFFEVGTDSLSYFLPFLRSAPVQCTSWGVPVTTGIPAMDYFVSSELLESDGAECHYSEQLVRLRTLPVCYARPQQPARRQDRGALGLSHRDHLYLCPQSLFKLHPDFDESIAQILSRDPAGKLLFIDSEHSHWRQLLIQRFEQTMPDVVNRILFVPRLSPEDFVELLQCCDVILDTHPFGGGATTYEGLATGTPIVTLPGAYMRGRVTAACYRKIGVMECVADTVDDYVEKAVRLGTDDEFRSRIRSQIRCTCEALYDDAEAVEELREFFLEAGYSHRTELRGSHERVGSNR